MKKYSLYILFLMGLGAMAGSCTNLDEKIYDRLVDNNFYKNEKDIIAAITPRQRKPYASTWSIPISPNG